MNKVMRYFVEVLDFLVWAAAGCNALLGIMLLVGAAGKATIVNGTASYVRTVGTTVLGAVMLTVGLVYYYYLGREPKRYILVSPIIEQEKVA